MFEQLAHVTYQVVCVVTFPLFNNKFFNQDVMHKKSHSFIKLPARVAYSDDIAAL